MKVVCLGGGAAGLYFALSMKLRNPEHELTVIERNRPDDTFGWGVVFSDQTLENLRRNDPITADQILDSFAHWDDIEVYFKNTVQRSSGHGFCGIGRLRLLNILQDRCRELGVELVFEKEISPQDVAAYRKSHDLVIGSDGLNSGVRQLYQKQFGAAADVRKNKFVWLGTHRMFDAFSFIFEKTEWGWFWAHAYRFDDNTSTFIVECSQETWDKAGFEGMEKEEGVALCEKIFEKYLEGHALISNANHLRGSAIWINFPRITCERWFFENVILLGDAAHTAHFSIGSGTKLAFEDAILLADVINSNLPRDEALAEYQEKRKLEELRVTSAARNSTKWFEDLERYVHLEPIQFTYALLTRSQRVSHENLRLRDPKWLASVEAWFADQAPVKNLAPGLKPMFVPYRLRELELNNRVVVSPMSMYSSEAGLPNDFHLVHYGTLAKGGAGLLVTEMTDISADARITPGCAGIWNQEQQVAWARIVDFVHQQTCCRFCLQLGHAGPKGSTKVAWEGMDEPLDTDNWPVIGPSAIPYSEGNQVPRAMNREDMDRVVADYVSAAQRAEAAGFDMLELHCAHGYLLSAFITPLLNQRTDEYGGSMKNRLRFPLEVFSAIREVWPEHKPMSVRISANDWIEGGITPDDAVEIARAFHAAGADIIDVSAGQTSPRAQPVYGRMFQTPFSEQIRNQADLATMAVGNIYEVDHLNSILVSGRADLCCLARPHLANPFWTLHAAAELNYPDQPWPVQYLNGKEQLQRNVEREKLMVVPGA